MSLHADLATITGSDQLLTDPNMAASYVTDWVRVGLPQTQAPLLAWSTFPKKRKY
jgi:FAD/FMN-containing dehydrogenase